MCKTCSPQATGGATALFANTLTAGSLISGILAGATAQALGYRAALLLCGVLQAGLRLTGAYWLDDPPDVSCRESTRRYVVDDPRLSCKQQVGGSSPPASSRNRVWPST